MKDNDRGVLGLCRRRLIQVCRYLNTICGREVDTLRSRCIFVGMIWGVVGSVVSRNRR